jgi:hypothetical protein
MIRPNGLKELRIYVLAGKREFVASTQNPDGCGLYSVEAWGTYGNAEYWVDTAGRLLSRGEPTRWSIRDLQDTGRATTYPQSRVV